MIKVIYTNGVEANFHGYYFEHNPDHKMFIIPPLSVNGKHIMIPDHSVACIGAWDKEKEEFYQS